MKNKIKLANKTEKERVLKKEPCEEVGEDEQKNHISIINDWTCIFHTKIIILYQNVAYQNLIVEPYYNYQYTFLYNLI